MNDKDLIENLKKLSGEHEKHLSDIREKIRIIDTVPKAKALVGRCFKYRSGGAFLFGGKAKGWTFERVVTTSGDNLLVNGFSIEGPAKVEFTFLKHDYVSHFTHSALVEISKKAYDREFNKVLKVLAKMNKRGLYGNEK